MSRIVPIQFYYKYVDYNLEKLVLLKALILRFAGTVLKITSHYFLMRKV